MNEQTICRRDPEKICFWAALVFAAVAVFANLGSEGIYAAQEGRTAIILRNMLRTGNCLEMVVKEGVPYEKPIGHYWLCLPTAYLCGLGGDAMKSSVEWGIRIPSALCSLLTVLLAGLLGKRLYGGRVGAMAMVMLSTMVVFDKLGRMGHIDMPFAAAFMSAMYFLYAGYFEEWKPNRKIYLFYAALGWGMLLKGPLVIMLAGLAVAGMAATRGRRWYEVFRDLRIVRGALIVLAVSLPWYVYECIHSHGKFFHEFIVRQNLERFTGDPTVYRKSNPIWQYIPKLLAGALPWSIAALAGLIVHFRRIVKFRLSTGSRFLLIWFLTSFVFFSFSAIKRIDYLLPLFPALAIMTARSVDEWCRKTSATPRRKWLSVWIAITSILVLFFAVNTSGLLVKLGDLIRDRKLPIFSEHDGMSLAMFSNFLIDRAWVLLAELTALLALAFAAGSNMERGRRYRAFGAVAGMVLVISFTYHLAVEPGTDKMKTVKRPFAEEMRTLVGKDEKIVLLGDFNTELIYFMDRDNYRFVGLAKPDKKRDRKSDGKTTRFDYARLISANDRWIIAPPEAVEVLNEAAPGKWRERLRTIPNHQYPAVLLERIEPENKQFDQRPL